jgi:hypothetical protein
MGRRDVAPARVSFDVWNAGRCLFLVSDRILLVYQSYSNLRSSLLRFRLRIASLLPHSDPRSVNPELAALGQWGTLDLADTRRSLEQSATTGPQYPHREEE